MQYLSSSYQNFPQFVLNPQLSGFQSPPPPSQATDQDESNIHLGMLTAAATTVSDEVSMYRDLAQMPQTSDNKPFTVNRRSAVNCETSPDNNHQLHLYGQ